MIDYNALERRILRHQSPYARFLEFGTITGRCTTHVPPFKELPMTTIDRNPHGITDPKVRRLSEYLFSLYHSKQREPERGRHSRVSDAMAKRLAEDPAAIMTLATLMAYCHGMPETSEVTAFAGSQRSGGISDLLAQLLGASIAEAMNDRPMYERDLIDEDGDLDPNVLWARTWQTLGGDDADVSYDPHYHNVDDEDRHPAIHGHGVDPFTVNGAMISVLAAANMIERVQEAVDYMADTQDEDGWVYCA